MQFILIVITFSLSSYPILLGGFKDNTLLQLIHLSIALICSISLFRYKKYSYSLYKIVHLFSLFFLCIAPILQYKQNITLWGGRPFVTEDYIITSLGILCILLLYNLSYAYFFRKKLTPFFYNFLRKFSNSKISNVKLNGKEEILFLLLSIIVLYLFLKSNDYNFLFLFFRGIEGAKKEALEFQSLWLLMNYFIRPMGVVIFLCAFQIGAKHKIILFFLAILMLLIAFPTSMARFSAVTLYIPVFFTLFRIFKRKNAFVLIGVLGLLVVFPFLDDFRHYKEGQEINIGFNFEMFLEGHFDAYSAILRVMTNNIITYGNQLLGCLFFWIPRSLWPMKPTGSGSFLCEKLHLDFDNISCCYFAEGYINGGIVGIFVFVLLLAFLTSSFDKLYWTIVAVSCKKTYYTVLYFLMFGLLFFILRGDLMSSFAYTIGFLFSAIFIYYLLLFIRNRSL